MQLTHQRSLETSTTKQQHRNIALAIAQASLLLLSGTGVHAADINPSAFPESTNDVSTSTPSDVTTVQPWKVETAALVYQEGDGRVQATEPVINLSKDYGDEHIFSAHLVFDSLTGASPNGAVPANVTQTFTAPSGKTASAVGSSGITKSLANTVTSASGRVTTPTTATTNNRTAASTSNGESEGVSTPQVTSPNALPVDTSFKDQRFALSANWQQPVFSSSKLNLGANISSEYDFRSLGGNAALSSDFNGKNTTLSSGISVEADSIMAVGGAPTPFTSITAGNKNGDESKIVIDGLLGMTQVLGRHALLQLNYSLSSSNGYMTDPYKFLTLLDSSGNLIVDPNATSAGNQYMYLYEKRPDTRLRHSIYGEFKYIFNKDTLDLSYRYTTDDWGVKSQTVDSKYRFELSDSMYLEPHARFYSQTKADFYRPYLVSGIDYKKTTSGTASTYTMLDTYASADSRLGAFDATTFGAKLGFKLDKDSEFSVRVEQYNQTGKEVNAFTTGNVAGQKVQPDLSALIAQVSYSFLW